MPKTVLASTTSSVRNLFAPWSRKKVPVQALRKVARAFGLTLPAEVTALDEFVAGQGLSSNKALALASSLEDAGFHVRVCEDGEAWGYSWRTNALLSNLASALFTTGLMVKLQPIAGKGLLLCCLLISFCTFNTLLLVSEPKPVRMLQGGASDQVVQGVAELAQALPQHVTVSLLARAERIAAELQYSGDADNLRDFEALVEVLASPNNAEGLEQEIAALRRDLENAQRSIQEINPPES